MSTLLRSRRLRWIVPGGVAAAVAVASLTSSVTASASGRPKLPARTAAQLLATLEQANTPELSGTVVETAHLGIPDLSAFTGSTGGNADLSIQNLISGSHTLRVFYGGTDKQRIALLGTLSESDIVHNGTDVWTYSSSTHQVRHGTLPKPDSAPEKIAPAVASLTPMAQAQQALAAIDPTTTVTIDRTAYVADRSAYQVLLIPKDGRSLIGSVRIAVDSATSMPLRVQIFAAGAKAPAIQVGFTDVTFGPPNASVFDFIKPAGTTVLPLKVPVTGDLEAHTHQPAKPGADNASEATTTIGSGWTTVVKTTLPEGQLTGTAGAMLNKVSSPAKGGRLITSALVNVLITDDGHVYAGAVSAADLEQVAATGKAL